MISNSMILEPSNTVTLKDGIDSNKASYVIRKLHGIEDDTIYLYIKSPGGSVRAGNRIVQVMDALTEHGKNIICIADEAYSMAFIVFQACQTRYILPNSILMQHQMALMTMGQIERIRSEMEMYESVERELNQRQADRLKMSLEDFTSKVSNDWWMHGNEIMRNNAADGVVNVMCSSEFRRCPLY